MRFAGSFFAVLFAVTLTVGCHATPKAVEPRVAVCSVSHGLANIVLSYDGGETFVYSDTPFNEDHESSVQSLVALDTPGSLLAIVDHQLFSSEDGGCNWQARGKIDSDHMVEGGGGFAYAWRAHGPGHCDAGLLAVTTRGVEPLPAPPDCIAGLAAEPAHAQHLRIIGRHGGVFESTDRGNTWIRVGNVGAPVFVALEDPGDWKHVVLHQDGGVFVSRDGGRSWAPSDAGKDVWPAVVASANVVWAFGDSALYRSTDGGATFVPQYHFLSPNTDPSALVRRQFDKDALTLLHENTLQRYDARSSTWTLRHIQHPERWTMDLLLHAGTFVPGRWPALCLAFESSSFGSIGRSGIVHINLPQPGL
jgi:photosystem II stability/assembly factor-like uncharacterized protein